MKKEVKKDISKLPTSSGVYFFCDKKEVLYIGKATCLKNRVSSYFKKDILEKRGPLIEKMISETTKIKFQETETALEALILEANLIKKNQPKYNTKEKSDKSFVYLIITDEKLPRLFIKREKDFLEKKITEKIKYSFGPFKSKKELEEVLKIIRKIFPFYQRKNSYDEKSSFYKQIGLLPKLSITAEEYKENIKNIKSFFEGKKKSIIKSIEKQMFLFSKKTEFERANIFKNKLQMLKNISDTNFIDETNEKFFTKKIKIEAYDVAHLAGENMIGVMSVVVNSEKRPELYKKFNIKSFEGIDDNRALREVVERRIAHPEWTFPDIMVADGGIAQKSTIEKVLREKKINDKIKVVSVVKDQNHKPKGILGAKKIISDFKKDIILANFESHRFSINAHRKKRDKKFLG